MTYSCKIFSYSSLLKNLAQSAQLSAAKTLTELVRQVEHPDQVVNTGKNLAA